MIELFSKHDSTRAQILAAWYHYIKTESLAIEYVSSEGFSHTQSLAQ